MIDVFAQFSLCIYTCIFKYDEFVGGIWFVFVCRLDVISLVGVYKNQSD